jgi:hypothetical protein
MVLAITHDDAFEAYMPRAFPAECVGSICGAAEVLGDLLLWRRPARACVPARAGFALGRHDCAQQLKGRVHPVEQSNTEDAEQPVSMIHAA